MTQGKLKILVYGYGNPGRQDDGLGVRLAEEIEKWSRESGLENIKTDSNYQLNLEDAADIAPYDVVIFADASGEQIKNFLFEPLKPSAAVEFTMHAVAPAFILHLCNQIFDRSPEAYLMHLKGYKWEFMEAMTEDAIKNFNEAFEFLRKFVLDKLAENKN